MYTGRTVFLEVYKNLARDTDLKIILLDYQNNYVGRSSWYLKCQNFLQPCLSRVSYIIIFMIHNFGQTLFSDSYLAQFLDNNKIVNDRIE